MIMYLNKRIIFGWLLLGGLFAGACGEDEPAPAAEPLDLSIRAALAPVLTADGTASVEECRMEWSADDAFGLWGRSSRFADNNVCFTLQEVSADGEGIFSGSVSDAPGVGPQTLRALYLYRDNRGFDPAYLSVKLPAAQIQSGGVCDVKRYGFLVATLENADVASGEVAMEFSTPCAVLKLEIDAAGTPLADKKLSSVRIESERPLIGSMIYNLERNEVEVPCNGKTVNLTLADTPSLSSKCAAWFTLCEAELASAPLKIQLLCTDKSVVDIVCEPQIALQAARVSELSLNLAALIASGDAEVSEFRVDLSENGTSNCYVVSAADKYKFRPTRGNSNDLPAGMTRIDWLWMSAPDLIAEVGYEKGMVVFRAGEARGNAVIAAFNDAGEIVWSWHIWLTEDPAADLHAGMSKSYQLLDRNLGAVSTEVDDYLSYGLYYQWGRKDPFIGPRHHGTKVKREETPRFLCGYGRLCRKYCIWRNVQTGEEHGAAFGRGDRLCRCQPDEFRMLRGRTERQRPDLVQFGFQAVPYFVGIQRSDEFQFENHLRPVSGGVQGAALYGYGLGRRCRCQSARDVERRALRRHVFGCGGFVVLSRCGLPRPYGRFPLLYGTVRYLLVGHDLQ